MIETRQELVSDVTPPIDPRVLPPIYFINLPASVARREQLTTEIDDLATPVSSVNRVEGVDAKQVQTSLASGMMRLAEGVTLWDGHYRGNADANINFDLHSKGIYRLTELACLSSHLKAIGAAYAEGHQAALIVEDDVSFKHEPMWASSLQELVLAAPADWQVLQLFTSQRDVYHNFTTTSLQCGQSTSELFVPWKISHWGTSAYLISRAGMSAVLNATEHGATVLRFGISDELIYSLTKAYTLTRPLFAIAAGGDNSLVQPSRASTDAYKAGLNARINDFVDSYYAQDAAAAGSAEWAATRRQRCMPHAVRALSIAIVNSASGSDNDTHRALASVLALGAKSSSSSSSSSSSRGLVQEDELAPRWVYAVNAIDNDEAKWEALRPQFVDAGVQLYVRPSHLPYPAAGTKLSGQLGVLHALATVVLTRFVWLLDGDIRLTPEVAPALLQTLQVLDRTRQLPVISQPVIDTTPKHDGNHGQARQWFQVLNSEYARTCANATAPVAIEVGGDQLLPLPYIETQATLIATSFVQWYAAKLHAVAQQQLAVGSNWGHDSMWCSAAEEFLDHVLGSSEVGDEEERDEEEGETAEDGKAYLSERLRSPGPDPCALLVAVVVQHENTKTLHKDAHFRDEGQTMKARLAETEPEHYLWLGPINRWWASQDCAELVEQRRPLASYRRYLARQRLAPQPKTEQAPAAHRRTE